MELNNKIISYSAIVRYPVKEVWNKWTTHSGLLSFFGSDNKIEIKPGGAYEIYFLMDNPYGLRGSEGCKVLSYLPEKMLSFSWNAPPQYAKIRRSEYKTWVVVEMVKSSSDETKVTISHLGWPEDHSWEEVYDYFDNAWQRVLKNLQNS